MKNLFRSGNLLRICLWLIWHLCHRARIVFGTSPSSAPVVISPSPISIRARTLDAARRKKPQTALDHALAYAREGIRIIWIPARTKAPVERGWPAKATTDVETIERWAVERPGCNFGLCMGGGFVALDIDDPSKLPDLKAQGFDLPPTRVHQTSHGLHFIYRVPPSGIRIKNAVKKFGILDIRHEGGQIVSPGSVHPSGFVYRRANDYPIAQLPNELIDKLAEPEKPLLSAGEGGPIPEGQRNSALLSIGGSLRRRGLSLGEIEAALQQVNRERCEPPLLESEVANVAKSLARYAPDPAAQQALLNDPRPRILLPGEDRLLSDVAAELGDRLADDLYVHSGEIVRIEGARLSPVNPQVFRTLVEKTVVCCKFNGKSIAVGTTMAAETAKGILASPQFRERLKSILRVNTTRLPVLRDRGQVELLPEGFDEESRTLTISEVHYREDATIGEAVAVFKDLFGEFHFADEDRSMAVAIAALLGLYAAGIVPTGELRPSFIVTKNAEGAGATTLISACVVPILGALPTGVKPKDDDEMRKTITAAVREGRQVIFLDNVKGLLNLPSLEAFISAPTWNDRLLGVNETAEGPNVSTVFVSGNGMTISPDMRRRSLFVELHLSEERAEDKVFRRPLSVPVLQELRASILAAAWSFVRNWDVAGRPVASRGHSAFPAWAACIGGIVEAAGYACPLDTGEIGIVADEDGDHIRALATVMKAGCQYKFQGLVDLCRSEDIFPNLVGVNEYEMKTSQRSAFGKLLQRYKDRMVGEVRFLIDGPRYNRRYWTEAVGRATPPTPPTANGKRLNKFSKHSKT